MNTKPSPILKPKDGKSLPPTSKQRESAKSATSSSAAGSGGNNSRRAGEPTVQHETSDHDFDNEELFVTTYMVVPPDGGWGWVIVAATFFCTMVAEGLAVNFNLVYLDVLMDEFKASLPEVVLIMSLLRSCNLIVGPLTSALINRYGFRTIAILGSFISSASFAICYFANSITFLCIFYGVCAGIGNGMVFMSSTLCLSFYFQRWRPVAVCLSSCGSNVGGAIMGLVLIYIRDLYGWRTTMLFTSSTLLACSFLAILYRPIKPIRITKEKVPASLAAANRPTVSVSQTSRLNSRRTRPVNSDYPTAARFVSQTSVFNRQMSAVSMKTIMNSNQSLQTSTFFDGLEPLNWIGKNPTGSGVSMRLVVGQEKVTGYSMVHERERCHWLKRVFCCRSKHSEIGARPMYRDDIFYDGHLDHRQMGNIGLNLAVTRLMTKEDIDEEKSSKCKCCPVAVQRTLYTMLHFSLFRSWTFLLLVVNSCLLFFSSMTPYAYMPKRSMQNGMDPHIVKLLISALSIAGLTGKLATAVVTLLFPRIDLVMYCNVISTVCGVAVIAIGSTSGLTLQLITGLTFSVTYSAYFSLRSLIAVQLLGLQRLTNAFGLMQLFSGLASVAGPPALGWLQEVTQSFDVVFWVAGAIILVGAFILYPAEYINNLEKRRSESLSR